MLGFETPDPLNRDRTIEFSSGVRQRELGELTRRAMAHLDMRYRMVLALRLYENMSYSEIACIVGCSEENARAWFLTARLALTRELKRVGVARGRIPAAIRAFGRITLTRMTPLSGPAEIMSDGACERSHLTRTVCSTRGLNKTLLSGASPTIRSRLG